MKNQYFPLMLENCYQSPYRSVKVWWNFFLTLPIISMAVSWYCRAHLNSPPQNYSDFNSDVDATKVFIALRKTWKASLLFASCRLVPKIIFFDFFLNSNECNFGIVLRISRFLLVWALLWQHSILVSNKFTISMILNLLTMPRTAETGKLSNFLFRLTPKVFFYSITYVFGYHITLV